ncbi:MAG TPA: lipoyl(octanoyl) transferase LipB [Coleofasciculaceae cyanobacterium]|jgi:lipoate-protein ligase B
MNIRNLEIKDFGLTAYETVWQLQKELVEGRQGDEIPDTLLMGEHPPVITLGRGTHAENLLMAPDSLDIPIVEIERGGDVTFHGPGQLIAYPIFKLEGAERDLHAFLRKLEEALILTLAEFGLQGERNPGWTGAWVRHPQTGQLLKIASIGVAVKKWVTYHGLALNVSTDLNYFRQINPCGLESTVMTSLSALLGKEISVKTVKSILVESFKRVF